MNNNGNKHKLYLLIIGILLLTNIVLVAGLIFKKDCNTNNSRPDRKAMITAFLKNDMHFNKDQLASYDSLSKAHRLKMKNMIDHVRPSKEKQFRKLAAASFSDSAIKNVADSSAAAQVVMEMQMFGHLKNVRALCTAEQLPKFDSLFGQLLGKKLMERNKSPKEERK